MLTDLRFMIGIFFNFCGITLLASHFFGNSDWVDGIHMNLFSGGLMLAFGLLMTLLAWLYSSD